MKILGNHISSYQMNLIKHFLDNNVHVIRLMIPMMDKMTNTPLQERTLNINAPNTGDTIGEVVDIV